MSREQVVAPGFELVAKVFNKYHGGDKAGASFAATHNGKQVVDLRGMAKRYVSLLLVLRVFVQPQS